MVQTRQSQKQRGKDSSVKKQRNFAAKSNKDDTQNRRLSKSQTKNFESQKNHQMSKKDQKQLQGLTKKYIYSEDPDDPTKIVSYLKKQTFQIFLKKDKSEPIELLQQIKSIDKLIQKHKKQIQCFFRPQWNIYDDEILKNDGILKIISYIQVNYSTPFLCLNIMNPRALSIFSHIKFSTMTVLYLIRTNITNLQPLTWLNCPNLKKINIAESRIHSLQPLNKAYFPNCDHLWVKNALVPFPKIDRMKFTRSVQSSIIFKRVGFFRDDDIRQINEFTGSFNRINMEDIKPMCKIQGQFDTLKCFFDRKKSTIKQFKVFNALERKINVPETNFDQLSNSSSSSSSSSLESSSSSSLPDEYDNLDDWSDDSS